MKKTSAIVNIHYGLKPAKDSDSLLGETDTQTFILTEDKPLIMKPEFIKELASLEITLESIKDE